MQLNWTNRLSYKMARSGVIIAFVVGIILSVGQVYLDYLDEGDQLDNNVNKILAVAQKAATRAVHIIDNDLAEEVVSGMLEHEYITEASIKDEMGLLMARSTQEDVESESIFRTVAHKFIDSHDSYTQALFLREPNNGQSGTLEVMVNRALGMEHFFERSVTVFFSGLIRNMLLVSLLYIVFYFQITSPLTQMAATMATIDPEKPGTQRIGLPKGHETDELGVLVEHTNLAFDITKESLDNLKFSNKALEASEDNLRRRTWELEQEVDRAKLASKELLRTKEQAEAANRAKSVFLANVSHELRTPLNAIIGFSSVMANEVFGPIENNKYQEYLGDIRDSSQHLSELLGEVLDLAKVEANETELEEEEIDLRSLCEESKTLVGGQATQKKLQVVLTIENDIPIILGDRLRLKQTVLNLLSNAIKFTPTGGEKINLSVHSVQTGGVKITVADKGIGIPDGEQELVFSPFIRSSSAHSRSHEGTGLGLSLVSAFVAMHDGTIEVESLEGIGTTITIYLPVSRVS